MNNISKTFQKQDGALSKKLKQGNSKDKR